MIIRTKVIEMLAQSVPNFKPEITFEENLRKKQKDKQEELHYHFQPVLEVRSYV